MSQPTSDEWRKLYDLARQIYDMTPWEWMTEVDVFGVKDPETGEMGFVSVMGSAGEHFGIAVYRGAVGLHQFLHIQDSYDMMGDEIALEILEVPQLQLSFEDRDVLEAKDRAVIKELGLKFRGHNTWPLFRSTEPGWLPWFINQQDARFLMPVLEQLLVFAPHVKEANMFFDSIEESRFLVRVAHQENQELVWEDQMLHLPFVPPEPLKIPLDARLLTAFMKLPITRMSIEFDVFNMMSPTLDEKRRPFLPYMLLMVDTKTGTIVGQEMFKPEPDLDSIWMRTPNSFMQQCIQGPQARPSTLYVGSEYLESIFKSIAKQMGIKVMLKDELPALDDAIEMMMGFMGGFGF
jgi:hypothetical protein